MAPSGTAVPDPTPVWVGHVRSYAGGAAAVLGAAVLLAWMRHFSVIEHLPYSLHPMKANSALGAAFAGVSLLGAGPRWRWAAVVPLLIGGASLFEWISGHSLGIDQLLVHDSISPTEPGRPSPQVAMALVLFGLARLPSGSSRPGPARLGGVATAAFAVVVLTLEVGWLFQAPELTSVNGRGGMAAPSALIVLLLAVGLGAMHARRVPLSYLWDHGATGTVVRRLLPPVVLAPPAMGLITLVGQKNGWFGMNLGLSLFAGSMAALLVVVVTVTASSIHHVDVERSRIQRQLEAIFDSVPAALTMRDSHGRLIRYNRSPRLGADASAEEIYFRPPIRDDDKLLPTEIKALAERKPVTTMLRPTGSNHEYQVTKFPVYDVDGSVLGIGGFAVDVTARVEAERALRKAEQLARHLADHDPLTDIWNRRRFEGELAAVLAELETSRPLGGALMIVDVDHFKAVNDSLGHDAGDQLLIAVAKRVGAIVTETGAVSRLGGDEFAVMLCQGDHAALDAVAREVVAAVAAAGVDCGIAPAHGVTGSVGVAAFADLEVAHRTPRTALIRADEALYVAKRDGRGTHRTYGPGLSRSA